LLNIRQGSIENHKTSCDVGLHYGKIRANSVTIRNYRKPNDAFQKTPSAFGLRSPSCKRRVPYLCSRHDRKRKASGVFWVASKVFYHFRSCPILTEFSQSLPKYI